MTSRVSAAARLHFGFLNLSLARERLYGGIGVRLSSPDVVVEADPADEVVAPATVRETARRSVEILGVEGVRVTLQERLPHHVGLGSGTQHALATYAAIARAHDVDPDPRAAAPALGRGGRSGVGVATFESGGFVVDAGHPTHRFTAAPPGDGEWTVPPVTVRHDVPGEWRALLVVPDADPGKSGDDEDDAMRSTVENADPAVADRIAGIVTRRLLPAVAEGDLERLGDAVERVSRLNGAWYADEQGGVFRPPVGTIVETLADDPAVAGAGQSSWGPTTFGLTDVDRAEGAREAGERALDRAGVDGEVRVVEFSNRGARVE